MLPLKGQFQQARGRDKIPQGCNQGSDEAKYPFELGEV